MQREKRLSHLQQADVRAWFKRLADKVASQGRATVQLRESGYIRYSHLVEFCHVSNWGYCSSRDRGIIVWARQS